MIRLEEQEVSGPQVDSAQLPKNKRPKPKSRSRSQRRTRRSRSSCIRRPPYSKAERRHSISGNTLHANNPFKQYTHNLNTPNL